MLNLEEIRKIDPKFREITDEELVKIRDLLYGLANLAMDSYIDTKQK